MKETLDSNEKLPVRYIFLLTFCHLVTLAAIARYKLTCGISDIGLTFRLYGERKAFSKSQNSKSSNIFDKQLILNATFLY